MIKCNDNIVFAGCPYRHAGVGHGKCTQQNMPRLWTKRLGVPAGTLGTPSAHRRAQFIENVFRKWVRISHYSKYSPRDELLSEARSPTKTPAEPAGPRLVVFETLTRGSLAKRRLLLEKFKSSRAVKFACSDKI